MMCHHRKEVRNPGLAPSHVVGHAKRAAQCVTSFNGHPASARLYRSQVAAGLEDSTWRNRLSDVWLRTTVPYKT